MTIQDIIRESFMSNGLYDIVLVVSAISNNDPVFKEKKRNNYLKVIKKNIKKLMIILLKHTIVQIENIKQLEL
jgi:hypothetical protein